MPKFKNVTGGPLYLGRSDGPRVGDGEVTEVDGSVKELDDAYLVGPAKQVSAYGKDGADISELRLFPKSTWTLVKTAKGSES